MFRCNLSSGPRSSEISSGADLKAVDFLNRFFTNEVWDLLVTETNRYAALNISSASRPRPWQPVTNEEMKAFIGILMAMGILRLPCLE